MLPVSRCKRSSTRTIEKVLLEIPDHRPAPDQHSISWLGLCQDKNTRLENANLSIDEKCLCGSDWEKHSVIEGRG